VLHLSDESDTTFCYLSAKDVAALCTPDVAMKAVDQALRLHALGRTILPCESYLGWQTPSGSDARCLAMPGALWADTGLLVGLKTINSSLGNTVAGRKRSDGFTVLLDPETARPIAVMQAGHMSALRTAAVSAVGARTLAPGSQSLAIVGCGTLGAAHAAMLTHTLPSLASVRLFDLHRPQAESLSAYLSAGPGRFTISVAPDAATCLRGSDIVIFATTVTEGYVPYGWVSESRFVGHVSLDDLLPDVFASCDYLVVDDWSLIADDDRRVLGRLARAGLVSGPDGQPEAVGPGRARAVDATLGQLLTGQRPGPGRSDAVVVCNAFGMAILDVALAGAVLTAAHAAGRGVMLEL